MHFQEVDAWLLDRWNVPSDRGLVIIEQLEPSTIAFIREHCRTGVDLDSGRYKEMGDMWLYRRARAKNWAAVQRLLATRLDTGDVRTRAEYTNLSDIYHSLGASRLAVILAGAAYSSLFLYRYHADIVSEPVRGGWTAAIALAMLGLTYHVFNKARHHASVSLTRLLTNVIHSAFLEERRPGLFVDERRRDAVTRRRWDRAPRYSTRMVLLSGVYETLREADSQWTSLGLRPKISTSYSLRMRRIEYALIGEP